MKKLVLAAAIVCAAAVTQGAALAWGMSGISASPDVSDLTGSVAYFMDGADYDAFAALDGKGVGAFCAENGLFSATVAVGRGGAGVTATSGDFAAGTSVSGFIVVFDNADAAAASNFALTAVDTKTVPGSGSLTFSKTFATDTTGWQEVQTADIPEPTSGLLLLLGAAGLALRRRRA